MYRFLLTPRWWAIHAFVLLAIPVCVFMGSWQLGRFEDRVQSHDAAAKAPDPATLKAEPLASLLPVDQRTSGRPAVAHGRYAEQFLVPGREVDGASGSYVLTLLRTDGAKALPVVRGWIPRGAQAPAAPSGEVEVTGVLQASETVGSDGVHAQGGLPRGQVGVISAAALVNLVPYPVYDAWVTLPRADTGMTAVPASAPQNSGLDLKAFQNLGYTGEWFVFAGFVVFMWFRLVRREAEALEDAELGLAPEGGSETPPASPPTPEGAAAPEGSETPGSPYGVDDADAPASSTPVL